ncbi:MAG: hypothetical protein ACUVWX_15145 [Kiritimatiellia bacterium]
MTKTRVASKVAVVCVLTLMLACSVQAETHYTLQDQNSIVKINPWSAMGAFDWEVDNHDQLTQQWYWYRIGSAQEYSIDTIAAPVVTQLAPFALTVDYFGAAFDLQVLYLLTGGPLGCGASDLAETVTITNKTAGSLDFHLFEYSNFDLAGTPNDDIGTLVDPSHINQQDGSVLLTQALMGVNPIPQRWEINNVPILLCKLGDGVPTVLANATSPTVGDVEFAFQWDFTIGPMGTAIISKDKYISGVVPEPSSLVACCGLMGLLFARVRRRR